jgi:putative ABC transport system substrate-binding protein
VIRRREFIAALGGAAAWPVAGRAQPALQPVVGFVNSGSSIAGRADAFRKGLNEAGFIEGQNVAVEYHWLDGPFDRLPSVMADLVRRRVTVIVTPVDTPGSASGDDPVKLGLVASLARPGGNATGVNFFNSEVVAKRLGLLHELIPKAVRIAVLVNPADAKNTETTLQGVHEAAHAMGLQIQVHNASTGREIDTAFAALAREHADALLVAGDVFFGSRRKQIVTLAARDRIPTAFPGRDNVAAAGLMGYATTIAETLHQVGIYTGKILKGAKPTDCRSSVDQQRQSFTGHFLMVI